MAKKAVYCLVDVLVSNRKAEALEMKAGDMLDPKVISEATIEQMIKTGLAGAKSPPAKPKAEQPAEVEPSTESKEGAL